MKAGLIITGNCPEDVKKIILEKQSALKIKCNCIQSLETTIYKIIREWNEHKKDAD
jgi:hypothetical protein